MSTIVPVVAVAALVVSWLVADEAEPQQKLSKVCASHFPRAFRHHSTVVETTLHSAFCLCFVLKIYFYMLF